MFVTIISFASGSLLPELVKPLPLRFQHCNLHSARGLAYANMNTQPGVIGDDDGGAFVIRYALVVRRWQIVACFRCRY